jgi:hypothetical protein
MSADALTDVQTALIGHLRAQATLAPWLGSPARIYDQVPETPVFPYVSLGRVQALDTGGINAGAGAVTEQSLTLMVTSRFGGSEEVKAIIAELRGLIDQGDVTLSDHHLVSLWVSFVDVFRSADQLTVYGLVRVRAVTEAV